MMSFQQTTVINVKYCRGNDIIPMGRLLLKERRIFFEYSKNFLESGLELSPFKLPLKPGVVACEDYIFDGLFGIFNDSLPDGWGRLLIDRKLMKSGINPGQLTPLDRLRYVGSHGMGALFYEPEIHDSSPFQTREDLDILANECIQILDQNDEEFIDDLFAMNGSSGGARPKILISLINDENNFKNTTNNPEIIGDDWIIKFRSSHDAKDAGSIEYAYHLMAMEAGLDVPKARLFNSKTCSGYFGVKRFDHEKSKFLHMHTVSGLLHADYRIPSLDYETLMKTTLWLTKDLKECEKQFRNSVFNVLAHNRDDHAKNFSFLMDENGTWRVSPSYDLTFSYGPAGEHYTTIMGEGKDPTRLHLLKLAEVASITEQKALEIINQVSDAISRWDEFAKKADVSQLSRNNIQKVLGI